MATKEMTAEDAAFIAKMRSISIPRSMSGQARGNESKRKTERELGEQLNSGELSTASADAMAAIGGLCTPEDSPAPKRGQV